MMAAIDFPSSPNSGDQFVVGTITWTYDGTKWTAYPGVLSVPDAPSDGQLYGRQLVTGTMSWTPVGSGDTDAPIDNSLYGRKNRGWIHPTHLDITDWAATLAPYALTANVPGATSALPKMDGTATTGSTGKWADGDHVHPTDTSRYAANNPSGYQTAAQVTASLASYLPLAGGTLTGALTLAADPSVALGAATKQYIDGKAASTAPVMDGTAAVGVGATFARADHVHPTDTSRAAASALSNYLPLTGGGISGNLTVSGGTGIIVSAGNIQAPILRMNSHNFNFNYVGNGSLNQFACAIDGVYNVIVKSVSVSPFTSTVDTMAMNAAGGTMGAWAGGTGSQWTILVSSDRRLKSNLKPSSKDALATLAEIPVYECDMTQPVEGAVQQHWDWALIADEVEPVVPLAVIPPNEMFPYAAMREYPLIPMLIRAVQQLAARVAELEAAQL